MPGTRLDTALVRNGLARSRTHAARLIAAHCVTVAGRPATKASTTVDDDALLTVDPGDNWASRAAYKLLGALDAFGIEVAGRRAVDAGASHGGFTDVLLRRGAASVAAIDVGEAQLRPRLARDARVSVFDRTNVRSLSPQQTTRIDRALGGPPQLIVADLSFISLTLVLPVLLTWAAKAVGGRVCGVSGAADVAGLAGPAGVPGTGATAVAESSAATASGADVVPMVKPQFEVGRGRLGAGGVVRDPELRAAAVGRVAACACRLGWSVTGAVASPLPGPSGNVEYFLRLRAVPTDDAAGTGACAVEAAPAAAGARSAAAMNQDRAARLIRCAVEEGPQ